MSAGKTLVLCLCLADLTNFDVFLNQIGAGHVFGPTQNIHLVLQGSNITELEALRWDIQDCAFPLIIGISSVTSLSSLQQRPDIIMVLLAGQPEPRRIQNHTFSPSPASTEFTGLLDLVHYSQSLANMLAEKSLGDTRLVLLGGLSHMAASILSSRLNSLGTAVGACQVIALDGSQGDPKTRQTSRGQGQMSQVAKMCQALSQWWTGAEATPECKAVLGTKFVDTKRSHNHTGLSSGYFFSAPVEFTGPMTFSTTPDLDLAPAHVSEVKTETDLAHQLMKSLGDAGGLETVSSPGCHTAHYTACL